MGKSGKKEWKVKTVCSLEVGESEVFQLSYGDKVIGDLIFHHDFGGTLEIKVKKPDGETSIRVFGNTK